MQGLRCPLPLGGEVVYCRNSTAHCPQAVRQCNAGVPLPSAPRQWGSVLQEFHCPLPQAVRHCIAQVRMPTDPKK